MIKHLVTDMRDNVYTSTEKSTCLRIIRKSIFLVNSEMAGLNMIISIQTSDLDLQDSIEDFKLFRSIGYFSQILKGKTIAGGMDCYMYADYFKSFECEEDMDTPYP